WGKIYKVMHKSQTSLLDKYITLKKPCSTGCSYKLVSSNFRHWLIKILAFRVIKSIKKDSVESFLYFFCLINKQLIVNCL
ncbi:MAG TPA: hypothetical protein DDX00_02905, partial [Acinetobacter radioresistens]|nr:hypothetical protein [Acinetobacter radioresistens]